METMRKSWTDERVGDMQSEMRRGFDRVDADLRDVRAEMRGLRAEMKQGFARVDTDVRELRGELGAMERTMVIGFASLGAGVLASVAATVLAAVLS
jgi:hypothetical protein